MADFQNKLELEEQESVVPSSPPLTFSESPQPGAWRKKSRTSSGWSEFHLEENQNQRGRTHSGTDSDDSPNADESQLESPQQSQPLTQPLSTDSILTGANSDESHPQQSQPITQPLSTDSIITGANSDESTSSVASRVPRTQVALTQPSASPPPLSNRLSTFFFSLLQRIRHSKLFACTICSTCSCTTDSDLASLPARRPPPSLPPPPPPPPLSFNHVSGTGALDDPLVLRVAMLSDQAQDGSSGGSSSPLPGLNPASPQGRASRVGSWEERQEARSRRRSQLHNLI